MSANHYFVMVGANDAPIYEAEFGPQARGEVKKSGVEESRHLHQFLVHAALDAVDESMWQSSSMYLKIVDRFNDWFVSSYVTPSGVKFMLLHDAKNDDGIRLFLSDVHELYIKLMLNPFYELNSPIVSVAFDSRVRTLVKKHL